MNLIDELKQMGADTDEGLERLMNKRDFYTAMLLKFPSNIEKYKVLPFIEAGDDKTAFENIHSLKGAAGNLSLTPLYKAYSQICDFYRANKPDEAKRLYLETVPVQDRIVECINKYK